MPKIKSKTSGVVIDETPVESPEVETPIEEVPTNDETPVEESIEIPESVIADDEISIDEDITQKAPVKSLLFLTDRPFGMGQKGLDICAAGLLQKEPGIQPAVRKIGKHPCSFIIYSAVIHRFRHLFLMELMPPGQIPPSDSSSSQRLH